MSAASDFERRFEGLDHEIEVVSLGGECKEATIWFGKLAGAARRRATSLPSGQTWTDRDGRGGLVPAVDEPGGWVFDPDPALVRAGLVDSYAQAMELTRLGPQINLLTGEVPRPDGLVRGYRVQDVVAFDEKRLRRLLAERRIGRLDIKPRGVDITPEQLRPRLRLEGPNSATLILAGGASRVRAILAVRDQEPDQIASSQPLSRRGS